MPDLSSTDRYEQGRPFDGPQIVEGSPQKPEWGYIAGYFFDWDADKKNSAHIARSVFRNYDYIRLKDDFLFAVNPGPGVRILDIGCAVGATAIYCALQGAKVTGIDLSPSRIETANTNFAKLDIADRANAVPMDATRLEFPDASFDVVTSVDFLEHIDEKTKLAVLKECYRVLKPGGRMVHRTPNLRYLKMSLFFKRIRALLRLRNPMNVVIPHTTGDNAEHIGLVERADIERLLQACGIRNYWFTYSPLHRNGLPRLLSVLSAEQPVLRDWMSNDVLVTCRKSIILSYFP
jgi:2-polyprenyl-3-methyl-5-hydroxy-6-metoxy-1,4-benzoquinol methylase